MDWVLENARVIDPAARLDRRTDLAVADGRIAGIGDGLAAAARRAGVAVLSAEGWIAAPAFIDLHAHAAEPGGGESETLESLAAAAVAGGFATVVVMPDTPEPVDGPTGVRYILSRARECGVRLLPTTSLTRRREGAELAALGDAAAAGAVAAAEAAPLVDSHLTRRAMEYAGMCGLPVFLSPGEPRLSGDGVMHEGEMATRLGLRGIPAAAEEIGVSRDLVLAELTEARCHLQHVSTARAVARIREAKRRGLPVSCEVTVHHLFLTDAAVQAYDTHAKLDPPLRPHSDVAAVVEAVAEGIVDCIVTDHTPRAREEKEVEFDRAAWGAISLETVLGAVATHLVERGRLSWAQAIAALSTRPAAVLGLPAGRLTPGAPADVVVIDPAGEWTVVPESFASRSRNTPLAGARLRGRFVATAVGGEWVYQGEGAKARWAEIAASAAGSDGVKARSDGPGFRSGRAEVGR